MQAAGQEIIWYTPNMLKTITTNEHHSSLSWSKPYLHKLLFDHLSEYSPIYV
jgi:hypothetical protein